jgi:hypothetical protein
MKAEPSPSKPNPTHEIAWMFVILALLMAATATFGWSRFASDAERERVRAAEIAQNSAVLKVERSHVLIPSERRHYLPAVWSGVLRAIEQNPIPMPSRLVALERTFYTSGLLAMLLTFMVAAFVTGDMGPVRRPT